MKHRKNIIRVIFSCLVALLAIQVRASHQPEYSTAGFYELQGTGRTAYSMNPAWRFYKGAVPERKRPVSTTAAGLLYPYLTGVRLFPQKPADV